MYIPRIMEPVIKESLVTGYITTILGPRRVGKTCLIKHLLDQKPNIRLCELNLDRREIRERINNLELESLIEENCHQHIGGMEKLWIAIDEAQKCPALFDQIKIIYDTWKDSDKIKFILTGSAHLSLHQLSAESLAGRIELYYMQPFTLREMSTMKANTLPTYSLLNVINSSEPQELPDAIVSSIKQISPFKPGQPHLNHLSN